MPKNKSASTESPESEPKKGGRPKDSGFKPSPEQRGMVEAMTGFGITYDDQCKLITNPATGRPICKHTLIKAFQLEHERGRTSVAVKVIGGLYKNATTPTENMPGGNVTAQIFWTKTQLGWKEAKPEDETPPPADDLTGDEFALEAARRIAFTLRLGSNIAKKK